MTGRPALGYATSGASVTWRISRMMTMARSGPRPQFMPTTSAPAPRRVLATSAGLSPHIVRARSCSGSYWKNMVAITGRSAAALHARMAAVASWGNIIVSTAKRSTPPSASASACSLKFSKYCSSLVSPSGSYSRGGGVVGPMDPGTHLPGRQGVAREARPLDVELAGPLSDPVGAELQPRPAEGVGLDEVRAGVEVPFVDTASDVGVGVVPQLRAGAVREPRREEQGPVPAR